MNLRTYLVSKCEHCAVSLNKKKEQNVAVKTISAIQEVVQYMVGLLRSPGTVYTQYKKVNSFTRHKYLQYVYTEITDVILPASIHIKHL
jgi:hypothetical protein